MSSIPTDETEGKSTDESMEANNDKKDEEGTEKTLDENCVAVEETARDNVNQEETPAHENTNNKNVLLSLVRRIRIPFIFADLMYQGQEPRQRY
jgi:hypothetical protein